MTKGIFCSIVFFYQKIFIDQKFWFNFFGPKTFFDKKLNFDEKFSFAKILTKIFFRPKFFDAIYLATTKWMQSSLEFDISASPACLDLISYFHIAKLSRSSSSSWAKLALFSANLTTHPHQPPPTPTHPLPEKFFFAVQLVSNHAVISLDSY